MEPGKPGIHTYFEAKWIDRLAMLRRSQEIVVDGKIDRVDSDSITLDPSDLVEPSVEPAQVAR